MPRGVRPFLDPEVFLVIVSEIAVTNKIKHRARDVQTARCVPARFLEVLILKTSAYRNQSAGLVRQLDRKSNLRSGRCPDASWVVTDRDPPKTYILNRL